MQCLQPTGRLSRHGGWDGVQEQWRIQQGSAVMAAATKRAPNTHAWIDHLHVNRAHASWVTAVLVHG
jgi:hypothetical protein